MQAEERITIVAFFIFAACAPACSQDRKDPVPIEIAPTERRGWMIDTASKATERCKQIVGLPEADENAEVVLRLAKLTTDNTPYLSDQIIGRPLWHMEVRGWSVDLMSEHSSVRDPYERCLDVFVDPMNGSLLKIESRWPKNVPPMSAQASAEVATELLAASGNEVYRSFPAGIPKMSFVGALESLQRAGVNVTRAKQLIGQFVVRSTDFKKAKPVWAITLRGVFPIKVPAGWPQDDRYEYRYIIDAETGRLELITSAPSPMYLPGNFPLKK